MSSLQRYRGSLSRHDIASDFQSLSIPILLLPLRFDLRDQDVSNVVPLRLQLERGACFAGRGAEVRGASNAAELITITTMHRLFMVISCEGEDDPARSAIRLPRT